MMTALTFFPRGITNNQGERVELSFGELIHRFNDFSIRKSEEELPTFTPVVISNEIPENSDREFVSAIIFDLDQGSQHSSGGLSPFEKLGLRFLAYSRFDHCRISDTNPLGGDHYRVILPLKSPVLSSDYPVLQKWAKEISGSKTESECSSSPQYSMPGVADLDAEFEFIVHDGLPLDWQSQLAAPTISIPRLARKILTGQVSIEGKYKTQSDLDRDLIISLVRGEQSIDDIRQLLQQSQYPSKYRILITQSPQGAEEYLADQVEKAMKLDHTPAHSEAVAKARTFRQCIQQEAWGGSYGLSDRANLIAHTHLMEKAGKLKYHASVRDLASLAKLGVSTVSESNTRLVEKGVLQLHQRGKHWNSALYEICTPLGVQQPNTQLQVITECSTIALSIDYHGVFERSGIGKSCQDIYERLILEGPLSPKQIEQKTKRARRTVFDGLKKLVGLGLLIKEADGKYAITPGADFQQLGRSLGTSHLSSRRQKRFSDQREKYHQSPSCGGFHDSRVGEYLRQFHREILA